MDADFCKEWTGITVIMKKAAGSPAAFGIIFGNKKQNNDRSPKKFGSICGISMEVPKNFGTEVRGEQ